MGDQRGVEGKGDQINCHDLRMSAGRFFWIRSADLPAKYFLTNEKRGEVSAGPLSKGVSG